MKKLLIVGDSFMCPDDRYPKQHWSEMLDCDVINMSAPGASNSLIFYQLIKGLESKPDAVVVGLTDSNRITFESEDSTSKNRKYFTSAQRPRLNADQILLDTQYRALTSDSMGYYTAFFIMIGMLREIQHRNIPFVYTPGLMTKRMHQFANDFPVTYALDSFKEYQMKINLSEYPDLKINEPPWFHVDDITWQKNFADEIQKKLLDNLK